MEQESLAKMIGILFMSRTYAHMAHLKTGSFAKHKALNGFYDSIVDLTDTLAETSQGIYGKMDIPFTDMKGDVSDPIAALESHLAMITNLNKRTEKAFIDNIVQEIQALYYQTLYLLKELD
jgi:hypothetical protein